MDDDELEDENLQISLTDAKKIDADYEVGEKANPGFLGLRGVCRWLIVGGKGRNIKGGDI